MKELLEKYLSIKGISYKKDKNNIIHISDIFIKEYTTTTKNTMQFLVIIMIFFVFIGPILSDYVESEEIKLMAIFLLCLAVSYTIYFNWVRNISDQILSFYHPKLKPALIKSASYMDNIQIYSDFSVTFYIDKLLVNLDYQENIQENVLTSYDYLVNTISLKTKIESKNNIDINIDRNGKFYAKNKESTYLAKSLPVFINKKHLSKIWHFDKFKIKSIDGFIVLNFRIDLEGDQKNISKNEIDSDYLAILFKNYIDIVRIIKRNN